MKNSIEITDNFSVNQEILWVYLTDKSKIGLWWDDRIELQPWVGGDFIEPWENDAGQTIMTQGKVLAIVPPKRLLLSWTDENWDFETIVEFNLVATSNGTTLSVVHSGFENAPKDRQKPILDDLESGWKYLLNKLKEQI
ncbi:SRPBCC family protein [Flagellimonas sp.]|uniref:SRPBCC family protein n=1 Tax=Flagellimonas sp. TaxID=2058762 RepID=UPI003F4A0112